MSEQPPENSDASIQPRSETQQDVSFLGTLGDRLAVTFKLLFDRRVSIWSKLAVLASVGYIISPLDFIPEGLLGPLGLTDDVGVLGILIVILTLFIQIAPVDVVREHLREMGSPLASQFNRPKADDPEAAEEEIIEGTAEYVDE